MEDQHIFGVVIILLVAWIFYTKENELVFIKSILRKFYLFLYGVTFMIYSKDTKGVGPKYNDDPNKILNKETDKRTIIFIRHGGTYISFF